MGHYESLTPYFFPFEYISGRSGTDDCGLPSFLLALIQALCLETVP